MPAALHKKDASSPAPPLAKCASPAKRSRLSLKFFQKKYPKRALDFEGRQVEEAGETAEDSSDQVVPATQPSSPPPAPAAEGCCEKKESLLPFAGLSNLGNTCYLNSVLQVLYYCPGFTTGVKQLFHSVSKKKAVLKGETDENAQKEGQKEDLPASYELICSLHSLMLSIEQLQTSFLVNPEKFADELAAQPRTLLNTLRELNPMYEGFQQHDAQEVLQCILGYIEETCQVLKKEESKNVQAEESMVLPEKQVMNVENQIKNETEHGSDLVSKEKTPAEPEETLNENGKRKSDTEVGNAKKKTKVITEQKPEEVSNLRRSKRRSSGGIQQSKADASVNKCAENESTRPTEKKSRLSWLKSSGKQPSILSKFCSLGKLSTSSRTRRQSKDILVSDPEEKNSVKSVKCEPFKENGTQPVPLPNKDSVETDREEKSPASFKELNAFELVEKLFQGQLVLRTRCLECECFTERREDFQDISVPVQEDDISKVEDSSENSPDSKTEIKCLKWAISQFASVERIVGEDKYFCENCHHYTEAERSLLFDKMPEVITIHLKCFAASGMEFDNYGGLSKINTPLQTPLTLSLDEWSTKPNDDLYGLFAVVMHSGITITSGHYTAYVKIADLNSLELVDRNFIVDQMHDLIKSKPQNEDEARSGEYDDGEVSFKPGTNASLPNKILGKKNVDNVGLLGGQKRRSDCEKLTSKATNSEKIIQIIAENKNSDTTIESGNSESSKETELDGQNSIDNTSSIETKALNAIQGLKEYEGKWLLFDDSEVKITEEIDFLVSLSPSTTSTSTPYLLFYKKIVD